MPKRKPAAQTMKPELAQMWMEITARCAAFAMDRLQADMAAHREMIACSTPNALMQTQAKYCLDTAQAYNDQTAWLVQMISDAMSLQGSNLVLSRKYNDVPI